jgi:hypothetical protein
MLSVPIPNQKEIRLTIKWIPLSFEEQMIDFTIQAGEFITIAEIK